MEQKQYDELSDALGLSEDQKLKFFMYQERQKQTQAQAEKEKQENSEENKREKRQKILGIKDDTERQTEIAKNRELFK